MTKAIAASAITALVVAGGSATAATLITSSAIKDGTIQNRDIKKSAITKSRLSKGLQIQLSAVTAASGGATPVVAGPAGAGGTSGAKGEKGEKGENGAPATFSSEKWGVIDRNTTGAPVAQMRVGPFQAPVGSEAATLPPPLGNGSLGLLVDEGQHLQFGNESDFNGIALSTINTVKYSVFAGLDTSNVVPNLSMEIDPTGTANTTAPNYSSLVYIPEQGVSFPQAWHEYDAIGGTHDHTSANGYWYLTGAAGTSTGCTLSAGFCTLADVKAAFPNANVRFSVAFNVGTGGHFHGGVDKLVFNADTYDFEPLGVFKG